MNNSLKDRFDKYDDDKLFEILLSKQSDYRLEAIKTAQSILIDRGHEVNIKELFARKLKTLIDEDLIEVIQAERGVYQSEAIEVATKILEEREYEIVYKELETAKEGGDYLPLILGVVIVGMNFLLAGEIYEYSVTGRGSKSLIEYAIRHVSFYDIFNRLLVIGVVIHYRKKNDDNLPILWIIGAIIFGGWTLIILGIVELFNENIGSEIKHKEKDKL